jgi:SpoOM protein
MFDSFKNFFGVDTVKIVFYVLPVYPTNITTLNGELEIRSSNDKTISQIHLTLHEFYARGTGEDKKITKHEMGSVHITEPILVKAGENTKIFFKIPFEAEKSNMDKIADSNFLLKKLVNFAKSFKAVQSEYELTAIATVVGDKLLPLAKKQIFFDSNIKL